MQQCAVMNESCTLKQSLLFYIKCQGPIALANGV